MRIRDYDWLMWKVLQPVLMWITFSSTTYYRLPLGGKLPEWCTVLITRYQQQHECNERFKIEKTKGYE